MSGTDMIAPTTNSAADICGALNTRLRFNHEEWTVFAERVFATQAQLSNDSRIASLEATTLRAAIAAIPLPLERGLEAQVGKLIPN